MGNIVRPGGKKNPAVRRVNGMLTAQLAPDQILVALSLEFADNVRVQFSDARRNRFGIEGEGDAL
jgi:hypothetical protein